MTAKIASVHFAPVHCDRSIYGGMYDIPAIPPGAPPVVLEIDDKVQRDEGPVSMGPGGGRRAQLRYHVDGYEIAADLIGYWTQNGLGMTPDAHPGIWLVRDRMPVYRTDEYGKEQVALDGFNKQIFRPATTEEAQRMWDEDVAFAHAADRRYAEWCYIDGNRMGANVNVVPLIPPNYKRAARHYGFQAEWLKEGAAFEVFPCPMCAKIVSKVTIVCPFCQQVIDLERYARREAEKQSAVRDAVKAMTDATRPQPPQPQPKPEQPLRGLRNNPSAAELVGA